MLKQVSGLFAPQFPVVICGTPSPRLDTEAASQRRAEPRPRPDDQRPLASRHGLLLQPTAPRCWRQYRLLSRKILGRHQSKRAEVLGGSASTAIERRHAPRRGAGRDETVLVAQVLPPVALTTC